MGTGTRQSGRIKNEHPKAVIPIVFTAPGRCAIRKKSSILDDLPAFSQKLITLRSNEGCGVFNRREILGQKNRFDLACKELIQKFSENVERRIQTFKIDRAVKTIFDLENVPKVSQLMETITL